MSTHTRFAAPGIGGRESAGRAAQVSEEWGAAGKCRSVRTGWGLESILIQATEGTEITEKCKNALCTRFPMWLKITLILYFNIHTHHRQQSPTPEAATRTHHFPTHALRMSTHTRSAVPGMGGRSSVGRAAQVSGEWRAAGERKKEWGLDSYSI